MGLNAADIFILALVAAAVAWAIRMIIKHNREGSACCAGGASKKNGCCSTCSACAMAGRCESGKDEKG